MMSPKQLELVRSTFSSLEKRSGIAALSFYQELFTLDPSLRALFHTDIEAQGQKLMTALRFIVDTLESPQEIRPMLESLGRRHVTYGVREEHYETVGIALLNMLQRVLGAGFSAKARDAWREAYGHVAKVMKDAAATVAREAKDEIKLARSRALE
jgi:hemoglobin-like flavoprotein